MPETTAVLSYTRKDDEFFGGYITAFRKSLELGVHVVTGREDFRVFQDIEGIVIGENWQKKIADVIDASTFLVPMLSPLFFNSDPCRDEVSLFLQHEADLQRNDLILPVYFIESPKLEKPEERAKDRIMKEIHDRQLFDWRESAKLPLQEPAARDAIIVLAKAIAAAIDRLATVDRKPRSREPVENEAIRATPESQRETLANATVAADISADVRREEPSERVVLWVDDRPDNNRRERRALAPYGIRFELATTTQEAQRRLSQRSFHGIISDMSRPGDSKAGLTLLDFVRASGSPTPFFIYAGWSAPRYANEGRRRGAELVTNDPETLIAAVVATVR